MSESNPTGTRAVPLVHKGHTGNVLSVAFAPDGKSVASCSWDKTIRIWDAYNSCLIGEPLTGHTGFVNSVSYSPLADIIVSGSGDETIRLWDTNTHQQIGEPLKGHTHYVNSVVFSPDGSLIASGSTDQTVLVWDVKQRRPTSKPFKGHVDRVRSVVFFPDGTRIASGSSDGKIRIWDVEHGQSVVGPLLGHSTAVESVAVSPDGSQVISGSYDRTLRLWDTRSGAVIGNPIEGHNGRVYCVSFSPIGIYVTSSSGDTTVRVWDVRTGRQVDQPYEQHTEDVNSVAFSPSGRHIVSGSDDKTVVIWDVSNLNYEVEDDSQDSVEEVVEDLGGENMDLINRHMSAQHMFRLLCRHGCDDLSSQMDPNQNTAVLISGGGFGDIWRGELRNGTKVAIKTWREALINTGDYKTLKRAVREIYYWSKIKHGNVHQLMGVVMFKGQSIGMVSEWMTNGNVHEYLQRNANADRLKLCIEVASGLAYIHSLKMVHGDIKAFNVLVSSDGLAKLTDFGISTMTESSLAFSATTTSQAGSVRWAAPELLLEESVKTKESDVYALGMVSIA
ncbi:WD40-repeat-containing domain protein [Rhizoctonia solani]|nr:WD40-repeat-containing domain protein [Rhizoctonia solani]